MFKFVHQHSIEVDLPVDKLWEIIFKFDDLSSLPECFGKLEFLHNEEIKKGSIVDMKINGKKYSTLFTELKVNEEYEMQIKTLLVNQEILGTLNVVSQNKTKYIIKTVVRSMFIPFLKSYILKKLQQRYSHLDIFLAKKVKEFQEVVRGS